MLYSGVTQDHQCEHCVLVRSAVGFSPLTSLKKNSVSTIDGVLPYGTLISWKNQSNPEILQEKRSSSNLDAAQQLQQLSATPATCMSPPSSRDNFRARLPGFKCWLGHFLGV